MGEINLLLLLLLDESREQNVKLEKKKTDKNPFNSISIVYFLWARLFTKSFTTDEYYPSVYFPRTGIMDW